MLYNCRRRRQGRRSGQGGQPAAGALTNLACGKNGPCYNPPRFWLLSRSRGSRDKPPGTSQWWNVQVQLPAKGLMVATIGLVACALTASQVPSRAEWFLAPQLVRGQELVYTG